jgi:hypothetical protein
MTVATSPYLSMIAKKRAWQATPVDNAPVKEGAEDTLFRALALRHLELPVKDLLEQGLQRDLPPLQASLKLCGPTKRTKSVTTRH